MDTFSSGLLKRMGDEVEALRGAYFTLDAGSDDPVLKLVDSFDFSNPTSEQRESRIEQDRRNVVGCWVRRRNAIVRVGPAWKDGGAFFHLIALHKTRAGIDSAVVLSCACKSSAHAREQLHRICWIAEERTERGDS